MQTTAKDLRFNTKELLEYVARGEEVIITYRGKECAKLIPFYKSNRNEKADELFGIWKDRKDMDDVDSYIKKLRKPRYK